MSNWKQFGSVTNALALIRETKELMEKYSSADASDLDDAIKDITEGRPIERKEAFWRVSGLCHPKAYGDLYMKDIPGSFSAWHKHLEKLERSCKTAYKKLEEEFESLTQIERTTAEQGSGGNG